MLRSNRSFSKNRKITLKKGGRESVLTSQITHCKLTPLYYIKSHTMSQMRLTTGGNRISVYVVRLLPSLKSVFVYFRHQI